MKFFSKRKNIQKIIITFIFLILFNFIVPNYSSADAGGLLSSPVVALLAVICDSVNCLMANFMVGSQNWLEVYPNSGSEAAHEYINNNKYDPDLSTVVIMKKDLLGDYGIPNLTYTPGKIFSGDVKALDVNFFTTEEMDPLDEEYEKSIVAHLRGIVASWYTALRNVAIVGLLSVLIYLGIRLIVTSSNAEKAKYKQSILDWVVAMCLVFFLHYIMSFTMLMVDAISDMIGAHNASGNEINVVVFNDSAKFTDLDSAETAINKHQNVDNEFSTSLMGAARIQVEYEDGGMKWSYLILYMALTIYTAMFTITYIKRVINMVFLTMMAPLVALTYPIDKAGDSKAQAFSFWLKEYIYNALMQPLHLLLYTVLISSALALAASNMLYSIIALAFILPAEKILKQMFNFRNSTTGGNLGGFAGGMVAKSLLDRAASNKRSGSSSSVGNVNRVRTANTPKPKDPDAPKGVSALSGIGTLIEGIPVLSSRSSSDSSEGSSGIESGLATSGGTSGTGIQLGAPTGGAQAEVPTDGVQAGMPTNGGTSGELARTSMGDQLGSLDDGQIATTGIAEGTTDGIRMQAQPTADSPSTGRVRIRRVAPSNPSEGVQETKRGGVIGGVKNVVGKKYRQLGGKEGIAKSLGTGLAKTAVRAASMAGGTAVGIAAGAVTGDLNDVAKFGLGGAIAGNAIGNNLSNRVEGTIQGISQGFNNVAEAYIEGSSSAEDVARRRLDKQEKQFKKNYSNRQYFRENFSDKSDKEIDEIMDRAAKYDRGGVKDLDRIKDAIKLEDKLLENVAPEERETHREQAQREALTMAKIRDDLGPAGFKSKKAVEDRREALVKELQNNGMNEQDAKVRANATFDFMSKTLQ